jgi:hypothetical protein
MQKVESKIVNRQLIELMMSDGIRTSEMASVPLSTGNDKPSRVSAPASRDCLLMFLIMCISQMWEEVSHWFRASSRTSSMAVK